jgi:hypothetical protein
MKQLCFYFYNDFCNLSLFSNKIEMLFHDIFEYSAMPEMNKQEQHQKDQKFFCDLAAALADGKLTPEHACSMIEKLRDIGILADDILDPEQEKQKGFNEIAGVFADWKITTEEACEVFVEWFEEWKPKK